MLSDGTLLALLDYQPGVPGPASPPHPPVDDHAEFFLSLHAMAELPAWADRPCLPGTLEGASRRCRCLSVALEPVYPPQSGASWVGAGSVRLSVE